MTSVQPYLVTYSHPVYPQRTVSVNALSLDNAQTVAAEQIAGTRWTVANVVLYTPPATTTG